jgi:hypothetical protein
LKGGEILGVGAFGDGRVGKLGADAGDDRICLWLRRLGRGRLICGLGQGLWRGRRRLGGCWDLILGACKPAGRQDQGLGRAK